MNLPQNDYQILRLTEHFYNAYPDPPYREVLKKNQRAYNCLLFQTHYDFFICIPYRRVRDRRLETDINGFIMNMAVCFLD